MAQSASQALRATLQALRFGFEYHRRGRSQAARVVLVCSAAQPGTSRSIGAKASILVTCAFIVPRRGKSASTSGGAGAPAVAANALAAFFRARLAKIQNFFDASDQSP